jgi:nitrous oxidase accessory protein
LFRDAQLCHIAENELERNGVGFFFYSSTENQIERNLVRHNEVGAKIWAGSLRNRVSENAFVGNADQIMYVSAEDLVWGEAEAGNHWSDYLGWDQDGDGDGDRPYRVDSFSTHLRYKYPSSALLLQSPILELLAHLSESLPLLKVSTVVDLRPKMQSPEILR